MIRRMDKTVSLKSLIAAALPGASAEASAAEAAGPGHGELLFHYCL